MLGALAAIALVVGGISTTTVLTEDQRLAAEETHGPIVEVQAVETLDASQDSHGF